MAGQDITSALTRIVAMQKEIMSDLGVTADAVPYFYHVQESFPYWTNRVGDIQIADDGSEDFDRDTYTFIMRLVIGHVTEGYRGEVEARLYDYIPEVKYFFNAREGLQSDADTTWLNSLIRARVSSCTGFRIFQDAGISANQVGTEFTLTCLFDETIVQAYH